ncbi:hypothetical protein [Pseudolabrys taiwanensis]|uniref:hypothetical protein n=1 Tax=Pseudolabrys taiwanensis TaxID=331696 RepID=UPI0013B41944|nr:hypothetical protein [Pseudolabrys taiwanensis]
MLFDTGCRRAVGIAMRSTTQNTCRPIELVTKQIQKSGGDYFEALARRVRVSAHVLDALILMHCLRILCLYSFFNE